MFPFIIDFSIRTKPCVYLPNAHTIFRYFDHYTNWLIVSAATVSHTYSNPKYCHFCAHRISLSRWIMLSYYRHRKKISFTTSFSSYALKMVVKGFRFTVISLLFYSKITTQNAKAFYKYHVKFFAWNHRLVSAVGNSATHSPCYQQPANEVLGTMTDVCAFIERSNEFAVLRSIRSKIALSLFEKNFRFNPAILQNLFLFFFWRCPECDVLLVNTYSILNCRV